MIKKLLFLLITCLFLSASAVELKKPKLGEIVTINNRKYDTFYYFKSKPQYLLQKYDMISIPYSVNLNRLNDIQFNGVYLTDVIKDVTFSHMHVKSHRIMIDENDRKSWIKIRNLLSENDIPVWPVVTYHAKEPFVLDGTMNLKFSKHMSIERREEILNIFSLEVVETSPRDPEFFTVKLPTGSDPFAIANKLVEKNFVRWAQPNWFWYYETKSTTPNDPLYANQWHLPQVLAQYAWDTETGSSSNAKIAIVDSGVDMSHPDLNVLSGYDYISNDSDPSPDIYNDDHQGVPHGTSCAGLAAAKGNNGLGVTGVCWGCPVIPVRLIGSYLYPSTIKNALEYAVDQGAWVVNNSWGPAGTDNYGNCISSPADNNQSEAVDYGRTSGRGGKGTIMVWAAGNDGCNTSYQGFLKDNDMITVSALESSSSMASYSNFGTEVDLSAGAGAYTTDIQGSYGYNYSTGYDGDSLSDLNYTSVFAGTSASAPVTSGAIALMMAANPDLTFSGVMNCAKASAAKTSKTCSKGGWTVQTDEWLASGSKEHSPCYGFGIVDTNAMVNGAKDGTCGECVPTADIDLCFGDGYDRDDDCDGTVDNECSNGGIGKAGDACSSSDDCLNTSGTPICITDDGWDGGYCSAECETKTDCYNSNSGVECYDGQCIAQCDYNEVRSGYECISDKILPEGTEVVASCGNDMKEGDEVCDGGYKPCTMIDSSFTDGIAYCRDDCRGYDTSTCEGGGDDLCGNNNVDADEICDGETLPCSDFAGVPPDGNVTCLSDCSGWDKSKCYNDGSDTGNTGNTGDTSDTGNTGNTGDTGSSSSSVCGNGVLEVGEQCDDGNVTPLDGCDPNCKLDGVKQNSGGCSLLII